MKYLVAFKATGSSKTDSLTFINKDVANIFIKTIKENGGEATLTYLDSSSNSLHQKAS